MPKQPKPYWLQFQEAANLAVIYAKDGAYHTAANLLQELAAKAKAHSDWLKDQGL